MSIVLQSTGGGSVTINEPATASNFTLTLPAATGNILVSTSQLVGNGTTTNDSASAGQVSEFVASLVQGVTCGTSSSVTSNLTSITLTAGDWDVSSLVTNYGAGNAVFGNFIATTNNANTGAGTRGLNLTWGLGNSVFGIGSCSIPRYRVSIASTTTYYLQTYGSGTSDQYDGYIAARRIR